MLSKSQARWFFVGAGFLGFAHRPPQVNMWTHRTMITAMHGHMDGRVMRRLKREGRRSCARRQE